MIITKALNNNVVSSLDEQNREVLLLGKGIGFQKREGDPVDESRIEKIFRLAELKDREEKAHFQRLVEEIPYKYVKYTDEIMDMARQGLGRELDRSLYITLTDHIHSAVERCRKGIELPNAMLMEIRRFYRSEFMMGLRAVEYINEQEGISLPENEAAFIALHIVNAEYQDMTMTQVMTVPGMVKDILNITRMSLFIEFDEESIPYERYVVHLKYMIRRLLEDAEYTDEPAELRALLEERYSQAYDCAKHIQVYLKEKTKRVLREDEMYYLLIHLSRLAKNSHAYKSAEEEL